MITTHNQLNRELPRTIVDCACCGLRLIDSPEFCPECETPANLSYTVASRSGAQDFISVLGASNAGKTVYLGLLLDILSKGPKELNGTANSAFAIDLQEQVITALEKRTFPEKTPSEADAWKWLHCQISMIKKRRTQKIDLISPDFAGEAIAMEVNQSGLYPAIQHVVRKSRGLMILCDSLPVRDAGSSEDLFAMKVATYIAELHGLSFDRVRRWRKPVGPAVAVVFTKCDGCLEAIEDPAAFAANNTPRLYEYCRRTFRRHAFFAASVVGSSGALVDANGRQMNIPFHIQPGGVIEPLQWIVSQD
jgi:hypothetical protein